MAQKKGRVTSVGKDGWAMVVTEREDACHNCEAAQFCHALADCSRMETKVINRAGAEVGDLVFINLRSSTVLKSALVLYILPTIGLLFGAFIGAGVHIRLGMGETAAGMLFGFAGLILGFAAAKSISLRQSAGDKLTPTITRIIKPGAEFHPSKMAANHGHK